MEMKLFTLACYKQRFIWKVSKQSKTYSEQRTISIMNDKGSCVPRISSVQKVKFLYKYVLLLCIKSNVKSWKVYV